MAAQSPGKSRCAKALGVLPVFISLAAIVTLYVRGASFLYEPEYLVGVANTVYIAIIPAIVAFYAARTYLKTGALNVLLMGCGMLGFGACAGSAGWLTVLPGGADFNVALYNTGALLGSVCHFAGSIPSIFRQSHQWKLERKPVLITAYSAPILFAVLFSFATVQQVVPPFFIQGVGPTAIRQIVLGLSIFLYTAASLLIMNNYLRIKSDFLYWYSLCLAMLALGLFAFYIERIIGSPLDWAGRGSNYVGSIFSLIAICTAVKSSRSEGLPLEEVISGFFMDAEANYRSLIEAASDAIISFDRENRIILWNSGARKIFGYSKAQAIGSPLFGMLIPEEYEKTLAELIANSRGADTPKTVEITGIREDGDVFPIEMSAFARMVPGGLVSTCIMRDITERKLAEESLRESRTRLQAALSSMTDAVIISDAQGRFLEFNHALATYYRYSNKESCLKALSSYPDIFDVYTADGREAPFDQWAIPRALRGETATDAQYILRRKDTGETWVGSYSFGPIRDNNGVIMGAVVSARDVTEHKRMEQKLRRSRDELELRVRERTEELLKATRELRQKAEIIDFAHDAVFVRDLDGRITFWNNGARETYGFKTEEALGQVSHELLKTALPLPLETITQIILDRGEWKGEIRHTKANGERIVVDSRWAIQTGKDGEPAGFIEINRDITARKIVEEELRKADRAFRTLSEFNQALVRQTDEMELLRQVCRIVADVGGYRLVWVGFAREDEDKTVEPIASAGYDCGYLARAKISWADNVQGRGPCGVSIRTGKMAVSQNAKSNPAFAPWCLEATRMGIASSISLPLIVEGNVIGALGIYASEPDAFDQAEADLLSILAENLSYGITAIRSEQKRRSSEAAVETERKRLFEVLETLPPMICLLTQDYHVAFANRTFRERFGQSHGRRCYEYRFGRSEPCDFCRTFNVLKTGLPHHWELAPPDGGVIDVYDFPFRDVDGSLKILEMAIDITNRKRAEAKLGETVARLELINKELEDFAFVAAHDLQEPLRKIQTFCDMTLKRCSSTLDATGREYLGRVVNSATRMRQLLHDLLEFSRVAAKHDPFRKVDLTSAAREAAEVFEASVKENGCLIDIENLPAVEADHTQMVQLFQNLIGNALKYCRDLPPHVSIRGKSGVDGMCEILVEDNGVGFEQKYAERIFKPFQRLHGRGEYQGTGMGLAVCRKIVERHGGTISAQSEPRKGSIFIIHIPAKQAGLEGSDIDV